METAANTSETCDIDPTVLENMEKSQLIKMIMCSRFLEMRQRRPYS